MLRCAFMFVLAMVLPQWALAGCAETDAVCTLDTSRVSGSYHIALPDGQAPEGGWPAIVFLHGWGANGAAAMSNGEMVEQANGRGYAVIAPDGSPREGRNGRSWHFHPDDRNGRDEGNFLRTVADEAAGRFGLDRRRMVLAGFSIGGSMVSYVACEAPESFSAYAPVAGSFWRPHPAECKAPIHLYHVHGWSDGTVPLEGRSVADGALIQGDVFAAMGIWRETNRCTRPNPDDFSREGDILIRRWTSCARGASLSLALHPGGHAVPADWVEMMLGWYEGLPGPMSSDS